MVYEKLEMETLNKLFRSLEKIVENDIIEKCESGIFLDFVTERQSRKTIYTEKCQQLKFGISIGLCTKSRESGPLITTRP